MSAICNQIQEEHLNIQEGDLRLWWIPQCGMDETFYYPIKSISEAKHMLDAFAMYDLFQMEQYIKDDFSNVGSLEMFEDGDWCDWYNEDGDNINRVDENGVTIEY